MKAIFFILSAILSLPVQGMEEMTLSLGETHLVRGTKIWIENSKILKAKPVDGGALLSPVGVGKTLVRINNETFQVFVVHPQSKKELTILKKITASIPGLRIGSSKNISEITGKIWREKDLETLLQSTRHLESGFVLTAEMPDVWNQKLINKAIEELKKTENASFLVIPGKPNKVKLPAKSPRLVNWMRWAGKYGIKVELADDLIESTPTVRVQITIAEVRKSFAKRLGIRWPTAAGITPKGHVLSDTNQAVLTLDFLESSGEGKILASPNLICRSGETAEFLAGGEFPIRTTGIGENSRYFGSVVWKKYGILLKVKPESDSSGRIRLGIESEISTIDRSQTVDGVPGLLTNRVSSHFDLVSPSTVILSGLLRNDSGFSKEGITGLSSLPILGPLFSSRDFREDKTELIVFVRPEILENNGAPPAHVGELNEN
ncbi:MAG: hypothetical protein N2578_05300 [Bdellovibrionaceae bacterium]|nr:hypothetical protein [Pseudobdellovibrionaceae bacterium]